MKRFRSKKQIVSKWRTAKRIMQQPKKGLLLRQKVWIAIVIAVNLALWLIPSDVVKQIARDRQVLLGRYSQQHFNWIVGVGLASMIGCYIDWAKGAAYKRRWFQVLTVLLFSITVMAVIDYFARSPERAHYVRDSLAYHHPPDSTYQRVYDDKPQGYRTYPSASPGYGSVSCTLRTDLRGFRNQVILYEYAVVTIGDSFTEGSNVSDGHAWPVRLAEASGLSVYNLGVSGYDPIHYLAALKEYGLPLGPRYVVCMLYEGNDFRSAKSHLNRTGDSIVTRIRRYIKQSPLISTVEDFLSDALGRVNSQGPVAGIDVLDWLPLTIPQGTNARHYTFAPKQLRDLYVSREDFSRDQRWLNPRSLLAEMDTLCRYERARLIVAYAPIKAHVMLPLVGDRLPAEKVRAFTAYSYKHELPEADIFLASLLERVESREDVVRAWCEKMAIPFVSMTGALREEAAAGTQVYYTYDQHWTPEGHQIVGRRVAQFIGDLAHATTSSR